MTRPAAPVFDPPIGAPPSLEWIAVAALGVDPAYQRSIDNERSAKLIKDIARRWDWNLCQPLSVTRREDGSLWLVDGQHRREAAALRGDIPHLPCVVARYASTGAEASAFVALNRQRKPLNAVDLYKASLAAGDGEAVTVSAMIADAGLTVAAHSNYTCWKPGQIWCVPGVQRSLRVNGRGPTATALAILAAAFPGQVLQYAGTLLDGLFPLCARHCNDKDFDPDGIAAAMGRKSQSAWLDLALRRKLDLGCSRAVGMTRVLRDECLLVVSPARAAVAFAPIPAAPPARVPFVAGGGRAVTVEWAPTSDFEQAARRGSAKLGKAWDALAAKVVARRLAEGE